MNKKNYKEYREQNPYHVWVHSKGGGKFVGHFKDKKDAERWQKTGGRGSELGSKTTASSSRMLPKKRKAPRNNAFSSFDRMLRF